MLHFINKAFVIHLKQFCSNACPQECYSIEYKLDTSSQFNFPALSYLRFLQASDESISKRFPAVNVSNADLSQLSEKSFLRVIVYYDNLIYTSFNESQAVTSIVIY